MFPFKENGVSGPSSEIREEEQWAVEKEFFPYSTLSTFAWF